jgi:hypothetical protein
MFENRQPAPCSQERNSCHGHPKPHGNLRRWLMSNHPDVGPCIGDNQVRERIRGNQVHRLSRSIDHHRVRYRQRPG